MSTNTYTTPRKALNKAYLKQVPFQQDILAFAQQWHGVLQQIKPEETEEFHKNIIARALQASGFSPDFYINTKGYADLVIHNDKKSASSVGVLLEVKSPTNTAEMPSNQQLNKKALQELLLYFFRERFDHENTSLKHLIITNVYEWFIFDATVFEKLFASDKKLVKQYKEFASKRTSGTTTDFFYQSIAQPAIDKALPALEYTWLDLRQYEKYLAEPLTEKGKKLVTLFKLFSPQHLLKLPFANDSNSLNKDFYNELLHILGLKEVKEKGKKLIARKPKAERHEGSLIENTIYMLDSHDKLSRIPNRSQYGETSDEQLFQVALELVITWVNRILFMKLLEAQLVRYQGNDRAFTFLQADKLADYDELDRLFFSVLARQPEDRPSTVAPFAHVPYLNSALFDPTDLEQDAIFVSGLQDGLTMPLFNKTVLKDSHGKRLTGHQTTLHYLLNFLEAYDFASESGEEVKTDNKTLINAAVLGLIFEKINGYQDGSYFTPGFVTEYMCRQAIEAAVIEQFNRHLYPEEPRLQSLDAVYDVIGREVDKAKANALVNQVRICDPAVGSGHFLVSALNTLLAIKSDLNILQDRTGRTLRDYHLTVENDELIVTDEEGELVTYKPKLPESQRVQEALFHEKQTLIEQCLFGVDINNNSVKICRLRLWIELLKHAYYKPDGQLETLPNIDINIKQGNSVVARFGLDADLKKALKKSKFSMDSYRAAVQSYREATDKNDKRELLALTNTIKSDFRSEITRNDPLVVKLKKAEGQMVTLTTQRQLFDMTEKEKKAFRQQVDQLSQDIARYEEQIEAIQQNVIFNQAFEWRFEFPEVLNDEGEFVGFDVILGNPPYIRQEELSDLKPYFQQHYTTYAGTADLYVYFVERAMQLLRPGGTFAFIIPNKWMRAGYGKAMRQYVQQWAVDHIVDFGDLPVFEEATTYPCLVQWRKQPGGGTFAAAEADTLTYPDGLPAYLAPRWKSIDPATLQPGGWVLVDAEVAQLLGKIKTNSKLLKEHIKDGIHYGVKTGFNEAFVIDKKTRDAIINNDSNASQYIFPVLKGKEVKRYSSLDPQNFIIYLGREADITLVPGIATHLKEFQERLEPKPKRYKGSSWIGRATGSYKWYETQSTFGSIDLWLKPKIIYPDLSNRTEFTLDVDGEYLGLNTTYMIASDEKWLLAILNSLVVNFYFKYLTSTFRGGYFRFFTQYVEQIPIPILSKDQRLKLSKLVDIIYDERDNIGDYMKMIDEIIFDIYNFTERERELIQKS